MRFSLSVLLTLSIILTVSAEKSGEAVSEEQLAASIGRLKPLHLKLDEPQPGDWLAEHEERGQSFAEYLTISPVIPQGQRDALYIQPIGEFSSSQQKVLDLTTKYMTLFFGIPVKTPETIPLDQVPDEVQRDNPTSGNRQILTTYILLHVLSPRLPDDAAAYIAFTSTDLWPGMDWNYVFGQASTRARVGVWSIYRNGDPSTSREDFDLCLERTIKTAVHETCHMFSMQHCTAYQCVMNGCNSLTEADSHPLYLCPECHAKVCWATRVDPVKRFRKLADFCRRQRLRTGETYYKKAIRALNK